MGFFVQATGGGTSTGGLVSASFSSSVSVGSVVAVGAVGHDSSTVTFSVSDSGGNTWTAAGAAATVNNLSGQIFYAIITTGGTLTVSLSAGAGAGLSFGAAEYHFPSGAIGLEAYSSLTISPTTIGRLATPTYAHNNLVMFALAGGNGTGDITNTDSATERFNTTGLTAPPNNRVEVKDLDNTSAGAYSLTWSSPSSGDWVTAALAFYSATPDAPPTRQGPQWSFPAPDFTAAWWQQHKRWPTPTQPAPPTRQAGQWFFPPPDLTAAWWQQQRRWPTPVQPPPPLPPPTRQPDQWFFPLPDLNLPGVAWRQAPFAPWYVPDRPTTRQGPQWFFPLPDLTTHWWQQCRQHPLPTGLTSGQAGTFGVYVPVTGGGQAGSFRARNDIARYNVYVGVGALPGLTGPPAAYGVSLPITVPVTPPVSGTQKLYVLTTRQDHYGLQSQNQYYTVFTIDSAGNLVLPVLPAPQKLLLKQLRGGNVLVLANYPTFGLDQYPADAWQVWADVTLPDPSGPPAASATVTGPNLSVPIGPYAEGTYYVMVRLYRSRDGAGSPTAYSTVTLSYPPPGVETVPSGSEVG